MDGLRLLVLDGINVHVIHQSHVLKAASVRPEHVLDSIHHSRFPVRVHKNLSIRALSQSQIGKQFLGQQLVPRILLLCCEDERLCDDDAQLVQVGHGRGQEAFLVEIDPDARDRAVWDEDNQSADACLVAGAEPGLDGVGEREYPVEIGEEGVHGIKKVFHLGAGLGADEGEVRGGGVDFDDWAETATPPSTILRTSPLYRFHSSPVEVVCREPDSRAGSGSPATWAPVVGRLVFEIPMLEASNALDLCILRNCARSGAAEALDDLVARDAAQEVDVVFDFSRQPTQEGTVAPSGRFDILFLVTSLASHISHVILFGERIDNSEIDYLDGATDSRFRWRGLE